MATTQQAPLGQKKISEHATKPASTEQRTRFVQETCGAAAKRSARAQEQVHPFAQADGSLERNGKAKDPTGGIGGTNPPRRREGAQAVQGATEVSAGKTVQLGGVEAVGDRLGRYQLLHQIGEGGCGTVYLAEQIEPLRRRVALKVIKLGMDTKSVIARFEAERQILALMDHPNIAKVLDAGATDTGRPYFVMELVQGVRITQFCDEHQLPLRERLDLFVQVCRAVQHAHQKGIIHRDIKPSNILVTLNDGEPVPKVIDFGIAKATQGDLTDKTLFTRLEQFIGTPAYMSPEQAEVRGGDIDTRSDIYSLGVVLYELLTGRTPFDSKALLQRGIEELILTLRDVEPPRPSICLGTLSPADLQTVARSRRSEAPKVVSSLRGDLDWIVMKCLEKDRTRRYDTANALVLDLHRHLADEPVVARPPSRIYRMQKAWQRNKLAFSAAAALAVALLLGTGVSAWQAIRATQAREAERRQRLAAQNAQAQAQTKQQEAERERHRAETSEAKTAGLLYAAKLNLAQAAFKENNVERIRQLLEETRDNPNRGFEWFYWQPQIHRAAKTFRGHAGAVNSVAFSPGYRRMVTGGGDGWIIVWDIATGQELLRVGGEQSNRGISLVNYAPDGERILASSGATDRGLRIFHAATGRELLALSRVKGGSFSPDGRRIATIRGDKVVLWDSVSGQELFSFKTATPFSDQFGQMVTYSPDGRWILAPYDAPMGNHYLNTYGLWDASTGEKKLTFSEWAHLHAFSPDSRRVVTTTRWGTAPPRIWDLANPDKPAGALVGNFGQRSTLKFSPDGRHLLVGGENRTAHLWDATTLKELRVFRGHTGWIRDAAFSGNGRWIATASDDETARLWDLQATDGLVLKEPALSEPQDVVFSPDGRWVASAHLTNSAIWDAATGKLVRKLTVYTRNLERRREWNEDGVNTVCFSPDSQRLVAAGNNYASIVFDVKTGQKVTTLQHSTAEVRNRFVRSAAFSPDGRRILTASSEDLVPLKIWDADTGQLVSVITNNVESISYAWGAIFSPDGRRIFATGQTAAGVWDAGDGKLRFPLPGGGSGCCRKRPLAVSADGRLLAIALGDFSVQLWDVATGQEIMALRGLKQPVTSAGFSADGQRMVTSSEDGTAKVWDVRSGRELLTLEGHEGSVRAASFSPDGHQILTCSWDRTIRIWNAATPQQLAAWQQEEQAGEELVATRKAEMGQRNQLLREEQKRKDAVMAEARAAGAAAKVEIARQAADPGAIKHWLLLAPIRTEGRDSETRLEENQLTEEALLRPHANEHLDVVGNYDGLTERAWMPVRQEDYRIDLNKIVAAPYSGSIGYLVTYLVSETERSGLLMKVGSDYQAKIYLNGRVVYERRNPIRFEPDRDKVEGIQLRAGVNVIVFKIVQSGPTWGGSLWLTEADGKPIKGLRVTLEPEREEFR